MLLSACGGGAAPASSSAPAPASAKTSSSASSSSAAGPSASASTSSAPASSSASTVAGGKLVISFSNLSADQMQPWMAQEGGFFRKHGLDTTVQLIESSQGVAALISGQTQFAAVGGSEVISAIASGADLVILATLAPVYPYKFEVNASIKDKADLRGKKIGVSRIGSSSDTATRLALRRYGLDPDKDVSILQVGSLSARTAAMLDGAIQAGLSQPPDTLTLESKGFHPLFDLASMGLAAANTVIVAKRTWVNDHHDVVQRFMAGLLEGSNRMLTDKPFAIGVMKKYLKQKDEQKLSVAYDYFTKEVLPAVPAPKVEQFKDLLPEVAKRNPKVKDLDVAKSLDPSFIDEASKTAK
ncbi:MAG: ABC transporter substrate-binding protein [Chloroflexota bacterium]|nr:ABC transporter substrate-binding protein [Chloroflexota bacterium]